MEKKKLMWVYEVSTVVRAEHKENQHFLHLIFLTTRAIAGQGLALRAKEESSSNFINILENMMEGTGKVFKMHESHKKYCSWVTQNEIIELFYSNIIRKILKIINECGDFGTMADEGSDASNTELLSSATRQCNEKLEFNEYWLGYQSLDNIKSKTVADGLKIRFKLFIFYSHINISCVIFIRI